MPRHIAWFNEALVEPLPEGGLTSDDLTVHRRCLMPARELENLGLECSVFGNLHDADPAKVGEHLEKLGTEIVVIGKFSGSHSRHLAREAKNRGCLVIADFGDVTDLSPDFLKLAKVADQIVVSTPSSAKTAAEKTGLDAIVIPDVAETADPAATNAIAQLWLDCFRKLKVRPPATANTNTPANDPLPGA